MVYRELSRYYGSQKIASKCLFWMRYENDFFSGYILGGDRADPSATFCTDIDECAMGISQCTAENTECTNVPGSYTCTCKSGFEANSDGNCVDIDECPTDANNCGQSCVNTVGSFHCGCSEGYEVTLRFTEDCTLDKIVEQNLIRGVNTTGMHSL